MEVVSSAAVAFAFDRNTGRVRNTIASAVLLFVSRTHVLGQFPKRVQGMSLWILLGGAVNDRLRCSRKVITM